MDVVSLKKTGTPCVLIMLNNKVLHTQARILLASLLSKVVSAQDKLKH